MTRDELLRALVEALRDRPDTPARAVWLVEEAARTLGRSPRHPHERPAAGGEKKSLARARGGDSAQLPARSSAAIGITRYSSPSEDARAQARARAKRAVPKLSGPRGGAGARAREAVVPAGEDPWAEPRGAGARVRPAAARPVRRLAAARPLPDHVLVPLLAAAGEALGLGAALSSSAALRQKAADFAARRVAEGHAPDDLVRAARFAAARWRAGERFPGLRNFAYVWGASMAVILAVGAPVSDSRGSAPQFRDGVERDEWERDLAAAPPLPDPATFLGLDTVPLPDRSRPGGGVQ